MKTSLGDVELRTPRDRAGTFEPQIIKKHQTSVSGEIVQSYTYDNLNRIKSSKETHAAGTQSWKETFNYDRFGNRIFDAANTTTIAGCPQAVCNPTISESNNRINSGQGYSYDQTGNVTQDAENQRFEYDAENHQIRFYKAGNSGSTPDAEYHYDGDGKRVRKIDSGKETLFVYNAAGSLIAEYETDYTPPATATTKYLTQDHLGSPRAITDQTGAIVSRHDYRAFGEEVLSGTASRVQSMGYGEADGIRQQYTGYERDNESGLDFAQARYYNSKLGRFTSVDPLTASANVKDPQTFNRYSYAMNSPYKFTDTLGLLPQSGCGAEYSSCDGDGGMSSGEAAYEQRVQNSIDAAAATRAQNSGDMDTFWEIVNGNGDLTAVNAEGNEVDENGNVIAFSTQSVNAGMSTATPGLNLIKSFEGFEATYYNDPVGYCTVGYGHLVGKRGCTKTELSTTISKADGLNLLRRDVRGAENFVITATGVKLNQNQFDALVSFAFNLGNLGKTLKKEVNKGNFAAAKKAFSLYVYARGKKLPGLIRRRRAEANLFGTAVPVKKKVKVTVKELPRCIYHDCLE